MSKYSSKRLHGGILPESSSEDQSVAKLDREFLIHQRRRKEAELTARAHSEAKAIRKKQNYQRIQDIRNKKEHKVKL